MQTKKIIGIALAAALVGSMAAVAAASVSAAGVVEPGFSLEGHSVGIIGGFNGWSSDIAEMTDDDGDGVYVGVVNNVAAGDTEFKIRLDGDDAWTYSWGEYEADYDRTFDSQTNCKISTTETTDLVVLLDTNGADPNVWAVNYFTVENEGGDPDATAYSSYAAIGKFNGWSADVAMTNKGGVYGVGIGTLSGEELTEGFKVRADAQWSDFGNWGVYEADYDRTENSQTNCTIEGITEAKDVQVFLNTNGAVQALWRVVYTYTVTDEEGRDEIVVVDTGKEDETPQQSSEPASSEPASSEPASSEPASSEPASSEPSTTSQTSGPRDSTIKDYVFFDNSQTKWDEVYAYWWEKDYSKTTDYKGDLWGCEEVDVQDSATGETKKGYNPTKFPGTKMTQVPGTSIWQVKIPFGATSIIFNSGKSDTQIEAGEKGYQTADLKFNDAENAGQVYTVDTTVEPKAGRGKKEATKFKYTEGAWSAYDGQFVQEKIEKEVSHESTPAASSKDDSTSSKAAGGTTNTASTTGTTVDAPQTGSVAMAVAFVTIATAALGAVVLAAKKKRDEE